MHSFSRDHSESKSSITGISSQHMMRVDSHQSSLDSAQYPSVHMAPENSQQEAPKEKPELRIQGIPYRSNTIPKDAIDQDEDELKLEESLRENEVQGEPGTFYPLDTVRGLFTRERVLAQLRSYGVSPNADFYVDFICVDKARAATTPAYTKIFAILTLIGKGDTIGEFVDAKLSDTTLPFYRYDYPNAKRQQHLFLKDTNTPIEVLRQWAAHERTAFENTQWMLLVPFLELGPGNMAQDYHLSDRDSLPWCKSKSDGSESAENSIVAGAYGKVYCVDIHRDCHGFHEVLQTVYLFYNVKCERCIAADASHLDKT